MREHLSRLTGLACVLLLLCLIAGSVSASQPGWEQSNASGFGAAANYAIGALDVFNGRMYAGTWNQSGAQVWRSADGANWSTFNPGWSASQVAAYDTLVFGPHLYLATADAGGSGGEIWRTDGSTWTRVVADGFGDADNAKVSALAACGPDIFAATGNLATGAQIWRSATGDSGSWKRVLVPGLDTAGVIEEDVTLVAYRGDLYAGLSRVRGSAYRGELWRGAACMTWAPVFTDGLGYAANSAIPALAEFQGELYMGVSNDVTGGQVWRSANGSHWTPVFLDGLGHKNNTRPHGLIPYQHRLYVVFGNAATGTEIWSSASGATWTPVMQGGWGQPDNRRADYFNKAGIVYQNALYLGSENIVTGGQLWRTGALRRAYLPLIMRGGS
jgi:hypothetical protein